MKHKLLSVILVLLAAITANAQQPPQIEQLQNNREWRFTRTVNYSTCDMIAVVKYAEIDVSVPQKTFEYDGTAHTPATVKVGDRILSLEKGEYRYTDNVNVGWVSVILNNNGGGEARIDNVFRIVQKEAAIVWSNTLLEYNGQEQKPVATVEGLLGGDQCTIVVDGAQTLPGSYTATANITGLDNYKVSGDMTSPFTINPRKISINADEKYKSYGDPDPELTYTFSGILDGDVLTGNLQRDPGEDAGVYAINIGTLTAGDNYTFEYTGASFTIKPLVDNLVIIWGETDFVYDGTEHVPAAAIVGLKDGDKCDVIVSGAQTDAGTYTATASLSNGNYQLPADHTVQFTISKAAPIVTPPVPIDGLIFDNHPHTLITAGSTTGGTMLYKIQGGDYSETLPQAVPVGYYDVYYYVDGGQNFLSTEEQSVRAAILPTDLPVVDGDKMECILSAEHFCNGKAKLMFLILAGLADSYLITFDNPEIPQQTGAITDNGVLEFSVPKDLRLGTYNANIIFYDQEGKASETYPFSFDVTLIADLIKPLYYNTLCADNQAHCYSSYQWTCNGINLSGETFQYLHPSGGRLSNGLYTVWVDVDGGGRYESCPFEVKVAKSKQTVPSVLVYPNPATTNSRLTIEIVDYDPDTKYQIVINNSMGKLIQTISNVQQISHLSLPVGDYACVLIAGDIRHGFKIVVK